MSILFVVGLKFCPMDRQTHVSSSPVNPGPVGTAPVQSAKGAVGFKGPVLFAFGFGFWCYWQPQPIALISLLNYNLHADPG